MSEARAIWVDGKVGTASFDPLVTMCDRAFQEGQGALTAVALPHDVSDVSPASACGIDDTFIPTRWKF
jgi:hypothetical protein